MCVRSCAGDDECRWFNVFGMERLPALCWPSTELIWTSSGNPRGLLPPHLLARVPASSGRYQALEITTSLAPSTCSPPRRLHAGEEHLRSPPRPKNTPRGTRQSSRYLQRCPPGPARPRTPYTGLGGPPPRGLSASSQPGHLEPGAPNLQSPICNLSSLLLLLFLSVLFPSSYFSLVAILSLSAHLCPSLK
ncbi:hypothetical protein HDV57DRAFT_257690 [Trichoderma longibrachiatum]|uniref:Uncharacterized protein n=1 Tax=Trichoderma longibrachiatum ATCC 18648 TaxID=983965 RepID=A0A2T4BTJ2_TRILO|nr:hypothetical protein M440DRAFT_147309 [Trichoderma longibrachiatum ATCC 18648]